MNIEEVDTDLIVHELRQRGHVVSHVVPVAHNAGSYIFNIDGEELSLTEVRSLLEKEQ